MSEYENHQLQQQQQSQTHAPSTSTGAMNDPQLLIGIPDANGFISTPRDSDVLCGRGGAALRHPGNQTYRRLVNLNKGLYITCLKTEKLKISRSIVAAIREQNGRFLEKNATDDKWYDIGDKKAIEKTSQALREGQPKLRQKIVELGTNVGGGGVAGSNNSASGSNSGNHHHLLHHNNGGAQYGENNEILIHGLDHHSSSQSHHPNHMNHHQMHQQQQQFDNATNAILQQQQKLLQMNSGSNTANSMTASDEIPSSNSMLQLLGNTGNISSLSINNNNNNIIQNNNINTSQNEFNTDYLLHRLSLHDLNQSGNIASLNMNHNHSSSSATGSNINTNTSNNTNNDIHINTQQQILQQQQQLLQQQQQILYNQQQQQQRTGATNTNVNPMTTRASVARELGISESQLSIMSDFSLYGNNNNNNNNNNINNTSNHIMNTSNIGSFMNGLGSGHLTNHLNDSMYSMLLNGSTNMSTGTFNVQNNNNNNNNSHMNQMMSSGGVLSTASNNDLLQQQLMNLDSFRNSSLMGLPISSFHMTQPNGSTTMMDASQSQLPAAATTTTTTTAAAVHLGGTGVGSEGVVGVDPRNLNHGILPSQQQYNNTNNIATNSALIQQQQLQLQQQQMQQQQFVQPTPTQPQKRQLPSSSIDTGNTGNPTSIEEKQKFDRRRVFAGMKYTRAPSVQHVSGGETGTSTTNIPTVVAIGGDTTEDPLPLEQQQQHPSSSTNPAISLRSINTLGTMTTSAGNDNNNSTNGTNVDEQLPNFHFVESNLGMETSTMSFFSTLSNTMPSTSNNNNDNVVGTGVTVVSGMQQQQPPLPTAGNSTSNNNNNNNSSGNGTSATIPSYDQQIYMLQKQQEQLFNASNNLTSSHQNNNNNNISNASRMHPPGAITIDTGYSKVVVESAKVVDKSSGRLNSTSSYNNSNMHHNSANYDAMSIGSRMSMMSGLSRISDGNENDSIFSDLSKKIGNVSTRSMAMSEMSALEIQELNDEDDADDVEDQQQQRLHEQEHHHHDIDVSSSATLTMDDDFS